MYKIYDSNFRGKCRLEDTEQIICTDWVDYNYPNLSPLYFHVVNESMMSVQGRVKARRKGLRKGIPDIMFLHPNNGHCGLMVELKREDRTKSRLSKEQKDYLVEFATQGYFTAVCYGAEQFKKCFKEYLHKQSK